MTDFTEHFVLRSCFKTEKNASKGVEFDLPTILVCEILQIENFDIL